MATLVLVRHGQASYGEPDYDKLSARGEIQARAIGTALAAGPRLDALYTGPLRRQIQTGAFAVEGAARALPAPTILPELAEYSAFEMLQHFMPRLLAEDPRFAAITTAPEPAMLDLAFTTMLMKWARAEWVADTVEHIDAFVGRVTVGLERVIRSAGTGARIGVVTSAGPIGVAVGRSFGTSAERMVRTSRVIRNASISELRFKTGNFAWHDDQLSLVAFNSVAHLPAELHTDR